MVPCWHAECPFSLRGDGEMARQPAPDRHAQHIVAALAAIEARFGPGVVRRLTAPRPARDRATGLGGLPRGGVTELLGPESSGKTALLHAALAAAQRAGGLAALVDAEGSADPEALAGYGVDLADLLVVRPRSAPDALLL